MWGFFYCILPDHAVKQTKVLRLKSCWFLIIEDGQIENIENFQTLL